MLVSAFLTSFRAPRENENVTRTENFIAGGALSALLVARAQGARGVFGHMAFGMSIATLAQVSLYVGIPEFRKQWPAMKKVRLSFACAACQPSHTRASSLIYSVLLDNADARGSWGGLLCLGGCKD